ncbi:hypothetical protein Tco_0297333 [Tanacetum coccineum]
MIITIAHDFRNLIITELYYTKKLGDEVGEPRAVSGLVLGAAKVQIPQNNLDNLKLTIEEDGTSELLDPREVPSSIWSPLKSNVGKIDCNRLNTGSITVKSGSNS